MLKLSDLSRPRRIAGVSGLALLATGVGVAAWAAQPAQIHVQPAAPTATTLTELPRPTPPAKVEQLAVLAASPAATAAEPAPQPAGPGLPNLSQAHYDLIGAAPDPRSPVLVEGTVTRVQWMYPSTVVTLKNAAGQDVQVNTDSSDGLIGLGGTRQVFRPGTPLSVSGYAAADGSRVFANPMAFLSNGQPLLSGAPSAENAARGLQMRAACGERPDFAAEPGVHTMDEINSKVIAWQQGCDAKLTAAAAAEGAVSARSPLTNAVRRDDLR